MTAVCKLCGEIISGNLVASTPDVPVIGEPARAPIEYQATIMALVAHVMQRHPDYAQVLQGTAQTYFFHLVAKLATSSDPVFSEEREAARLLCYWTLRGELEFTQTARPLQNQPGPQKPTVV